MNSRYMIVSLAVLAVALRASPSQCFAQTDAQPIGTLMSEDSGWENWRVKDGTVVARRVLKLQPQREHTPALSIQLIPNEYHLKEGNAAVSYLQAMGFFEQSNARKAKSDFETKNYEISQKEGRSAWPPHSWRELRPEDLPIEEVKTYLSYTAFQPQYLAQAAERRSFDLHRNIKDVENPLMFLLPEIQSIRELARTQSLRFLLAIAENRPDDAVAIFGQQLAIGKHLSQEPFIVSNLVGIACASIGWFDAAHLCELADAPNLYWAIASLPKPLVSMKASLAYEREFLFEQFKMLREVDLSPKSNLYWRQFVPRFSQAMAGLSDESDAFLNFGETAIALTIAAGVPGAKRYLHEVEGIEIEALDNLPKTQIFFLGVRKYYERTRDEMFKIAYLPAAERVAASSKTNELLENDIKKFGWITFPSGQLLPAVQAAMGAQGRLQQQLALLQTIESIRNHMAEHDNSLPQKLSDLQLPAPSDPLTGKPFRYTLHAAGATLDGSQLPGYRLQFELRTP